MSRHEGVSCDSCMKNEFTGRRYKCLRCCDYDLCSTCFEAGLATSRHRVDHAMQCLLTRADIDLYFGGEEQGALISHHSFTCPYCGKLGLSDINLLEHIDDEHGDETKEVVCPVCAATPGGDPNHMTEDLLSHLTTEHRTQRNPVYDDSHNSQQQRPIHNLSASIRAASRSQQLRRADVFISDSTSSNGSRELEAADPVSELLSQLTNARNRAQAVRNVSAQLHQLELQLQTTRQQLEGLPLRTVMPSATSTLRSLTNGAHKLVILSSPHAGSTATVAPSGATSEDSGSSMRTDLRPFLLSHLVESECDQEQCQVLRADRSLFVQELFLEAIACSSSDHVQSSGNSVGLTDCLYGTPNAAANADNTLPMESVTNTMTLPSTSQETSGTLHQDGVPDGLSVDLRTDATRKSASSSSSLLDNTRATPSTTVGKNSK